MSTRHFRELLERRWEQGYMICVGLDSDSTKIPSVVAEKLAAGEYLHGVGEVLKIFNARIIEATRDFVCAYKPNCAFYENHGAEGIEALRWTIEYIHEIAPDVPVILDAKRADIGNTNEGYVKAAFDYFQADAITVHPYLGREALQPFLDQADKGIFVLCRTSNPGAGEFQDVEVIASVEQERRWGFLGDNMAPVPLKFHEYVAFQITHDWNKAGNCGLVFGATYPDELAEGRKIVGDMPILIPGIGAQGGDVEKTVKAGRDSRGRGMIINSSRGIIFASSGPDFAEVARQKTQELHEQISQFL